MTVDGAVRGLVEGLRADPGLVGAVLKVLGDGVPGYEGLPRDSLVQSIERNRSLACRVLSTGEVPPSQDIWEARLVTLERLQQGVEIQDMMGGFRVVISCVQAWLADHAADFDVDAVEALRLSQLLWRLSDAFQGQSAMTYRQMNISGAVADERRQVEWVLGVLDGNLATEQVREGLGRYGLQADARLYALVSAAVPDAEASRLAEELTHSGTGDAHGDTLIVVPARGRLVGLATRPPAHARVLVAVGPPTAAADLPSSFAMAEQLATAATVYADSGVHTLESVSWRIAIPAHPETTAMLVQRYLGPIRDQGAFGPLVIEALAAWIGNARSIPRASASIPVHVNTLRYRLARFEEMAGCSLEDARTVIELSWALTAEGALS